MLKQTTREEYKAFIDENDNLIGYKYEGRGGKMVALFYAGNKVVAEKYKGSSQMSNTYWIEDTLK